MHSRDDFRTEVKRAVAARVGSICSNPECLAPTRGPQDDPAGTLNLGVAAHITAASPGGPRYDPSLSPEDRSSAPNGIWLCQNCAKLIDNDPLRFPAEVLRAWKTLAEHRARSTIGKAPVPASESEAQRKCRELTSWKGKTVTLSQMATGNAAMMIGPASGSSWVELIECTEFYVSVEKKGTDGWQRSIALSNIEISYDNSRCQLELQERHR
ncbi:MAG TPA: hypothetical protein VIY49_11695 [Bryobacteraceae bacterium]